jgi:UDP-N-acetylglucosamine 2-epimerase
MMKVLTCVGTRPNLIKITQLERCMKKAGIEHQLLHTGQHFDHKMNKVFFEELSLPEPDVFLNASL